MRAGGTAGRGRLGRLDPRVVFRALGYLCRGTEKGSEVTGV